MAALRGIATTPVEHHLPPWSPVLQAVVATAVAIVLALLLTLLLYCLYVNWVSRRTKKLGDGVDARPSSVAVGGDERGKCEEGGEDHWRKCFVAFPAFQDPSP